MSKEYRQYQEGLIRSILARPDEISSVVNYIDSKDFNDVNLKLVYESVLNIYLEDGTISLPEIALKIGEAGGVIDTAWLFSLNSNMAQWIQAAPPETWARLMKKEAAKYKAKMLLQNALKSLDKKEVNPLTVMDKTASLLSEISVNTVAGDMFDIDTAVDKFERETKEILATGGRVNSIDSAYPTIDYYTQGWGATHLITVGARTGVGKSVFAINNAAAAMAQEKTVLFFSLEMNEREVLSRLVSQLSMIPIQKIEKAVPLTPNEIERQKQALAYIRKSKLKIDTNPHVTVEYIKRTAIRQAQSEDGLDFIIIDYLQLIANDGKQNRQEAVAEISRNMKILAKELNVPVMVLVQLNREKNDEEDNTPRIYHIRESGAIAQDSNVVILIDRKFNEDDGTLDPKATFIIAKNRQGESNKYISVRARLECSLFMDTENQRGQEVLKNIERSVNENGDYDEVNYDNLGYQNTAISFGDIKDIPDDELASLFSENDDFANISDNLFKSGDSFGDDFDGDDFDGDEFDFEFDPELDDGFEDSEDIYGDNDEY